MDNFYHLAMKNKRKDHAAKLLKLPTVRTCFSFSQMRKISARIRCWTVPTRYTYINENQIPSPHHVVDTSDGGVMPPWPQTQHQVHGRDSAVLDRESGSWKTLHINNSLCHATQAGEPRYIYQNYRKIYWNTIIIIMSRRQHQSPWSSRHNRPLHREIFKATSCIGTELLYIGSSRTFCLCSYMWKGPQEYVTYEFALTSPACLVRLTWIVFVMGGQWPKSCCFVSCCLLDLFNIARSILV